MKFMYSAGDRREITGVKDCVVATTVIFSEAIALKQQQQQQLREKKWVLRNGDYKCLTLTEAEVVFLSAEISLFHSFLLFSVSIIYHLAHSFCCSCTLFFPFTFNLLKKMPMGYSVKWSGREKKMLLSETSCPYRAFFFVWTFGPTFFSKTSYNFCFVLFCFFALMASVSLVPM